MYFTIDLDCLDPSVFPGTGTPEAGGITFMQLLNALRPFLKPEKQGKVERAAHLARLIHLGKKFLSEWEG